MSQPAPEPEHAERFTGKVAEYQHYRERYAPEILLPPLRAWCGLTPDWTVADIGAGTGLVGDAFRANDNRVIAIEPNAEMRAACKRLHETDASFEVHDGSAENTGLADHSVEMIAIGRALHWFRIEIALVEFRRILKPRGWVVIVASGRDEEGREENVEFRKLMRSATGRDLAQDPNRAVYRRLKELFAGGEFHHEETSGLIELDWEHLRGLTLSLSHAPMPGAPDFPAFEAALRSYFDHYSHNGRVTLTSRTWISAAQFAD